VNNPPKKCANPKPLCIRSALLTPKFKISMEQKTYKCRFGLFVKLKEGIISHFPERKRVWYYPGDKFTDIEKKMFRNLISHHLNKSHLYCITELYDNQFANCQEERIALKIVDSVQHGFVTRIIERNNLMLYSDFLRGYPLPDYLKNNYTGLVK